MSMLIPADDSTARDIIQALNTLPFHWRVHAVRDQQFVIEFDYNREKSQKYLDKEVDKWFG